MIITMILYKNFMPSELKMIHCINCKRPIFRANFDGMAITNTGAAVPLGAHYTEHKCHSCLWIYRVLFQ